MCRQRKGGGMEIFMTDRKTAGKAGRKQIPEEYADIIRLPHHVSPRRPQMPRLNRAAQFAPFAALTGYGDEILEAGRATEQKPELSDSRQDELDRRLRLLTAACRHSGNLLPEETAEGSGADSRPAPEITVTYFVPDPKKEGGSFRTVRGRIRQVDEYGRRIRLADGTWIDADCITEISDF